MTTLSPLLSIGYDVKRWGPCFVCIYIHLIALVSLCFLCATELTSVVLVSWYPDPYEFNTKHTSSLLLKLQVKWLFGEAEEGFTATLDECSWRYIVVVVVVLTLSIDSCPKPTPWRGNLRHNCNYCGFLWWQTYHYRKCWGQQLYDVGETCKCYRADLWASTLKRGTFMFIIWMSCHAMLLYLLGGHRSDNIPYVYCWSCYSLF